MCRRLLFPLDHAKAKETRDVCTNAWTVGGFYSEGCKVMLVLGDILSFINCSTFKGWIAVDHASVILIKLHKTSTTNRVVAICIATRCVWLKNLAPLS